MKLKKLLITLGLTLTVGAGVAVTVNAQQKEEPKAAEAASSNCDVYFKASWNGANITQAKVHYWNGGDFWQSMTEVYTDNGAKVYKYTIPSGNAEFQYQTYTSNWGSGEWHTSVNMTVSNNLLCWPAEGWSGGNFTLNQGTAYPYTITYNGNGNTSGSMSNDTAYGNVKWGLKTNAYAKTGYEFSGWNTKANGSGTSYANQALLPVKTNTTTVTLYAQWRKVYATGRYIVGNFGDSSWGIEGAIQMTSTGSAGEYSASIDLEYSNEFKIAYYNGSSLESYFGYSWIRTGCGAYQYFSGSGNSNITCKARGTYNFYFRDVEYESGKKISVEVSGSLTSEHLAAQLMNFSENAGHCGDEDRFPAMKAIFLGLSSAEKTAFQGYASSAVSQFKNAYDRYTAWARALGEKPWETGKVSNALQLSIFNNNSASSSVIIIVVIASLGILTAGAYYFFKKSRKTEE